MYEIIYHDNDTDNESSDRVSCPLNEAIEWASQQVRDGEHWYIIDEDGETVADSLE